MENKSNVETSEKNLITLILQLTKELMKSQSEILKGYCLKLIGNNTSDRPHIKPFVEYVLSIYVKSRQPDHYQFEYQSCLSLGKARAPDTFRSFCQMG